MRYLAIVAGFFAQFAIEGIVLNGPILFPLIGERFQVSASLLPIPGCIMCGSWFVYGPVSALLVKRHGHRLTMVFGGVLAAVGTLWAAFAGRFWEIIISLGVVTGAGVGIAYLPAVAAAVQYFPPHRQHAVTVLGFVGGALGAMMVSVFLSTVLQTWPYQYALIALSALMLHITVCGSMLFDSDLIEQAEDHAKGFSEIFRGSKLRKLLAFSSNTFCWNVGCFGIFYTLPLFLEWKLYSADETARLFSVLNGTMVAGRIISAAAVSLLGTRINKTKFFTAMTVCCGLCILLLMIDISKYIPVALYGVSFGMQYAVLSNVGLELFEVTGMETGLSIALFTSGLGNVGPLAVGIMADAGWAFTNIFTFLALAYFVAGLVMLPTFWMS